MPKNLPKEKVIHINNRGNGNVVVNIVTRPVATPQKVKKTKK